MPALRCGLMANLDRDPSLQVTQHTVQLLLHLGAVPVFEADLAKAQHLAIPGVELARLSTCDIILSLGGDGTLLKAAHLTELETIPLAGINLGSLGFMADIEVEDIDQAVEALLQGELPLEKRMLLDVEVYDAQQDCIYSGFALNDAVLSRAAFSRIVTYELTINGKLVENIPGDGIILSTPTGSTGYSLAAGGPILEPKLQALLLTPLCPHTLHNRSYVMSAESQVEVRLPHEGETAYLSLDGQQILPLHPGQWLKIRRHPQSICLARWKPGHFYTRLPEKIQRRNLAGT